MDNTAGASGSLLLRQNIFNNAGQPREVILGAVIFFTAIVLPTGC